ncbi:hypothetical protein E2C01_010081 [Portunus trituberculatus]|uniref:Uncharacterized protein n=1 Tax=Portunus trituberculatus TaxID=210409 RepID=A0A5B7D7F3_PORTR|nr:hypothetical protein [Portunus trituberculatus]
MLFVLLVSALPRPLRPACRFQEVFPDNTQHREGLLQFLHQTVNAEEGTGSWLDMSAEDADQYDFQGEDYQWKNGYDTLITHLKAVKLGVANKVQIGWAEPWWGNGLYSLNILWSQFNLPPHMVSDRAVTTTDEKQTVSHILAHSSLQQATPVSPKNHCRHHHAPPSCARAWLYDVVSTFSVHQQKAVVELFVTGGSSIYMEELKEEEVKDHVMDLITKASGQDVPQPTFFRRWGRRGESGTQAASHERRAAGTGSSTRRLEVGTHLQGAARPLTIRPLTTPAVKNIIHLH